LIQYCKMRESMVEVNLSAKIHKSFFINHFSRFWGITLKAASTFTFNRTNTTTTTTFLNTG
ncbi:MAG: hypothetical protein J7L94_08435, partial [Caldisericaceae bacterium]|nr:hypothetical protein [Caldisericaceae bacterium]